MDAFAGYCTELFGNAVTLPPCLATQCRFFKPTKPSTVARSTMTGAFKASQSVSDKQQSSSVTIAAMWLALQLAIHLGFV